MTRFEATEKVAKASASALYQTAVDNSDHDFAKQMVAALIALGLIKFEEPKPETRRLYCKCAISGELAVVTEESAIEAVRNAGYVVGKGPDGMIYPTGSGPDVSFAWKATGSAP